MYISFQIDRNTSCSIELYVPYVIWILTSLRPLLSSFSTSAGRNPEMPSSSESPLWLKPLANNWKKCSVCVILKLILESHPILILVFLNNTYFINFLPCKNNGLSIQTFWSFSQTFPHCLLIGDKTSTGPCQDLENNSQKTSKTSHKIQTSTAKENLIKKNLGAYFLGHNEFTKRRECHWGF